MGWWSGRCCCAGGWCRSDFLLRRLIALKWRKGTDTAIVGRRRGGGRGRARQARGPVAHNSDTGDRRREIGLVRFVLIKNGMVGRNESGRVTGRPFGRSLTDSHPGRRSSTAPATTATLQDLRQTDRSWPSFQSCTVSAVVTASTAAADSTTDIESHRSWWIRVVRRISPLVTVLPVLIHSVQSLWFTRLTATFLLILSVHCATTGRFHYFRSLPSKTDTDQIMITSNLPTVLSPFFYYLRFTFLWTKSNPPTTRSGYQPGGDTFCPSRELDRLAPPTKISKDKNTQI